MRDRRWVQWCGRWLALAVLVAGCQTATGKTAQRTADDAVINASVQSKLTTDGPANWTRIDVATQHGTVRLTGRVDSTNARTRATTLASEVPGVQDVVNQLEVGTP